MGAVVVVALFGGLLWWAWRDRNKGTGYQLARNRLIFLLVAVGAVIFVIGAMVKLIGALV